MAANGAPRSKFEAFLRDAGIAPSEMRDARLATAADKVTLAVAELKALLAADPTLPPPSDESKLRVMEAVAAARDMDDAATLAIAE